MGKEDQEMSGKVMLREEEEKKGRLWYEKGGSGMSRREGARGRLAGKRLGN